ncbi:hypothetical protein [Paenibacillus oleatilyticus]|uniref:Uncharacterized protein n=1 Tax=Paenibacillus oleatilyticus TaxID=2594886 RepID=A0ABV4VCD5_9BACL
MSTASKTKRSALDTIKQKVRQSGNLSVHATMIDTNIIEEDRNNIVNASPNTEKSNVDVHVNVDEQPKKKKFEDMYTRATVWIKKEHAQEIENRCNGERGEKTRIINEAFDQYFSIR